MFSACSFPKAILCTHLIFKLHSFFLNYYFYSFQQTFLTNNFKQEFFKNNNKVYCEPQKALKKIFVCINGDNYYNKLKLSRQFNRRM